MTTQDDSRKEILRLVSCLPARMAVVGPRRIGKYKLVKDELTVLTSSQDLLEVDGSIGGTRQAQQFVRTTPVLGTIRVVLVDGRVSFSEPAQDAYLKICEDAPEASVIIIVVNDDGALRPALASRLDIVRLHLSSNDEVLDFMRSCDIPPDDFVVAASRGRVELCKPLFGNLEEMKRLHAAACDMISGKPDISLVPRLISDWSKLDDDVKDAALSTCELAICKSGIRVGAMAAFVEAVASTPSANAEIHWWRACLTV